MPRGPSLICVGLQQPHHMGQLSIRIPDELEERIELEREKVEQQTGYKPDKSEVVRRALREYLPAAGEPGNSKEAAVMAD